MTFKPPTFYHVVAIAGPSACPGLGGVVGCSIVQLRPAVAQQGFGTDSIRVSDRVANELRAGDIVAVHVGLVQRPQDVSPEVPPQPEAS
jgi:hypothetical protein